MPYRKPSQLMALAIFVFLTVSGCEQTDATADASEENAAPAAQQQMPLPMVDIVVAQPQTITRTSNLPARLQASRSAVIIPRVSGVVQKRLFKEGSTVKAGDVLFQLDQGTYKTALNNAKASLASAQSAVKTAQANLSRSRAALTLAETNQDYARKQLTRSEQLMSRQMIARQDYDEVLSSYRVQQSTVNAAQADIASAQAGVDSAKAAVSAAESAIETATINLSYTKITSPIAGVVGVSKVTEGAFAVAMQTAMVEVSQLDPLYLNITQPAGAILKLRQAQRADIDRTGTDQNIQIVMDDGTVYPHKGRLLFVDQSVDEATGEVTIRAEVPNPMNDLIPGLYVRVDVPQERVQDAYLIPQQAVTRGEADSVMIVEADGSYRPQPVTVGGQRNQSWIITQGLTPGAQVIVDGMGQMAIMMGAKKVQTRPWRNDTTPGAEPAASVVGE